MLVDAGDRPRLVSITMPVDLADPTASVFAARLARDHWFCWEQPERDGFAIAGLGVAYEATSRGDSRFADMVGTCARVAHRRLGDEPPELPAGAGPVPGRSASVAHGRPGPGRGKP